MGNIWGTGNIMGTILGYILNARGYEQVDGSHYESDSNAVPVTNPITVQIVLMLFA